jgi:hypothetical protein
VSSFLAENLTVERIKMTDWERGRRFAGERYYELGIGSTDVAPARV